MARAQWKQTPVEMWWHTVTHGRGSEGETQVSSITTADAHISSASSRLKWRPRRFKWIRPFRRKTKSGFCTCAITFQLASTNAKTNLPLSTRSKDKKKEDAKKFRICSDTLRLVRALAVVQSRSRQLIYGLCVLLIALIELVYIQNTVFPS